MTVAPSELFQRALLGLQKGRARCGRAAALIRRPSNSRLDTVALDVLSTFWPHAAALPRRSVTHAVRSPPMMRSCKSHLTCLKPGSAEGSYSAGLAGTPRHSTALVG